nr:uncharacterized protein LOC119178671 [Rhipicephalus microplus]
MAESADRKFRREINRRVNASFQLIDSEADVINDTRYVDRDSRNAERESDLPSEACAVDLEDGHRRLCVHDRERPSAHSSIVPETDVPQGHVLISGDACYPSGCSVSVPHDHTDFERRAFHDSSAAASTSATSQVRQRDSFELAPTGSNEEQVCERGSVDSLLAFRERLQAWALQSRASHTSVTSLLRVLQSHECFSALPSTARALLQTPKKCLEVLQLAGGKYHHFGLSAGLQRVLQDCAELPRILKLSFNIDGLPVSKSSRGQFWCILGRISNLEDKAPFIVGVFFGSSKPNNANDFLRPFVCDINAAITTGITIGETAIPVSLYALICDAPAKAFVLYVRSHTGYYSCTKCDVKGVYCEGRVCFPNVNARKRTDDSFRLKVQEEHHTGESILEELPFDLVKDIPLDYMHLVCLGVMNKLLTLWVRAPEAALKNFSHSP